MTLENLYNALKQYPTGFNAVVSNPPYQNITKKDSTRAVPIWPDFIMVSSKIATLASFINPGRWQKGGNGTGLSEIRKYMLNSGHLKFFINYKDYELFNGVTIGDLSIELFNYADNDSRIFMGNRVKNKIYIEEYIKNDSIDIAINNFDKTIISKILDFSNSLVEKTLWVGGQDNLTKNKSNFVNYDNEKDYAIMTKRVKIDNIFIERILDEKEYVKVFYYKSAGNIKEKYILKSDLRDNSKNKDRTNSWNALICKTQCEMLYRNIGPISPPNSLSTDSWLSKSFESIEEIDNFNSYLQTYFYRYLVSIRRVSHHAYANVHRFVPDLINLNNPRTGKVGYHSDWTDDDLRVIFKDVLTDDDWKYIKKTAIEADGGRGDYESGYELPEPYNWQEFHPGETWKGKRHSLSL